LSRVIIRKKKHIFEVPPEFEVFPDRLEITSAGRLPESLSREEFFTGISIPRNKELMRIYRDLDIVESLGSGIPRILRAYGKESFHFTDNFIRITFPASVQIKEDDYARENDDIVIDKRNNHASGYANDHASVQVGVQVNRLIFCLEQEGCSTGEIIKLYKQVYKQVYKSRWYFKKQFILPAIHLGLVEMVYPSTPSHPNQKYRLTKKGLQLKETLVKQNEG